MLPCRRIRTGVYPRLMVSPGPLAKVHEELASDCYACHATPRHATRPGAATHRCTECDAAADVGLKTAKGVPIPSRSVTASFHQEPIEQDSMACHSDHQEFKFTKLSRKPFPRVLLEVSMWGTCASWPCRPSGCFATG